MAPVATTDRVNGSPAATSVRACGWVTMIGAETVTPLLDDELLDDELLEAALLAVDQPETAAPDPVLLTALLM